jgi:uncharacterized protein DUF695
MAREASTPLGDGKLRTSSAFVLKVVGGAPYGAPERSAVLVGVITASNMREFVLHSAMHDWLSAFHEELRAAGRPHDVQMIGEMDPEWQVYGQFVS